MDLPLEALKIVSEAAPTQDDSNHNLVWTPENGFVLSISVGGQFQPIRFDYGDTINEIKEEIQMLTGIPMPEQKKPQKKEKPMDKEASKTPLLDGIQKEAVTISQLRRATSGLGNRLVRGFGLGETGIARSPSNWKKTLNWMGGITHIPHIPFAGFPKTGPTKNTVNTMGRLVEMGLRTKDQTKKILNVAKQYKGKILHGGDAANYIRTITQGGVRKLKTPVAREAFNRSVLLHEIAETGRHPGTLKAFSHNSLKPLLQDLNIASTLKGPGSGAAGALRDMRTDELEALYNLVPWVKKLNLGHKRINRHMIKKIQAAYEGAIRSNPANNPEDIALALR